MCVCVCVCVCTNVYECVHTHVTGRTHACNRPGCIYTDVKMYMSTSTHSGNGCIRTSTCINACMHTQPWKRTHMYRKVYMELVAPHRPLCGLGTKHAHDMALNALRNAKRLPRPSMPSARMRASNILVSRVRNHGVLWLQTLFV